MIKELVHDPIFLALKSSPAGKEDKQTVRDLLDTLGAHGDTCVGMAANMIGVRKRIIAFLNEGAAAPGYEVMLNPEIIGRSGPYDADESCLSLLGGARKCRRWRMVRVRYRTADLKNRTEAFTGFTAQIIQHEIDHCDGVLI